MYNNITIADNPLPQKSRESKQPSYNTKWSRIFKAIQDTGKRQELISPDGFWTRGQYTSIKQCAHNWSNRNGFGKIKVQSRSTRISETGPRNDQYQTRIWITVPTPKAAPAVDVDVQRLVDQIMAL